MKFFKHHAEKVRMGECAIFKRNCQAKWIAAALLGCHDKIFSINDLREVKNEQGRS